jgi:hypothetical protein
VVPGRGIGLKTLGVGTASATRTMSDVRGDDVYTTPGTYTWVAPAGVTSVDARVYGGGGGGSGGEHTAGGGASGGGHFKVAGHAGTAPGGGGGGGWGNSTDGSTKGGNGAAGKVELVYTPAYTPGGDIP